MALLPYGGLARPVRPCDASEAASALKAVAGSIRIPILTLRSVPSLIWRSRNAAAVIKTELDDQTARPPASCPR